MPAEPERSDGVPKPTAATPQKKTKKKEPPTNPRPTTYNEPAKKGATGFDCEVVSLSWRAEVAEMASLILPQRLTAKNDFALAA